MRLDDEDSGIGLQFISGTYGLNVSSACTIVIIAGKLYVKNWGQMSNKFCDL